MSAGLPWRSVACVALGACLTAAGCVQTVQKQPAGRVQAALSAVAGCTVTAASLTESAVQTAIDAAAPGSIVCLPSGLATWTTQLNLTKAVTLKGAGAGGYVFNSNGGESLTSLAIGTGPKTFTVPTGLDFTAGEPITARYPNASGVNFLTGTVASHSGSTLVLNVTTTGGSGTFGVWVFERPPATTIINADVLASYNGLILVAEPTTASSEISGINFVTTVSQGAFIQILRSTGGRPTLIHHNWFQTMGPNSQAVVSNSNRGVVWRNTFNAVLCSAPWLGCTIYADGAFGVKDATSSLENSWSTPSKAGALDTDGIGNFYVEDNYFYGYWQALSGADSNSRIVFRYNVVHNSTFGGHGADTELYGARYADIYNNRWVASEQATSSCLWNMPNGWIFQRGGTFWVHDNVIPDMTTGGNCYGDRAELVFTMEILQRPVGPSDGTHPAGCWGANQSGIQYPATRQIGLGYVTGLAGSDASGVYRGDSEPSYYWNNTGTLAYSYQDYGDPSCVNPDRTADYFVLNRDFFLSAKPNYTPYVYPHPLTGGLPPPSGPVVDCVMSAWTCSGWTACDANGVQTRTCTRTILTPPANGGLACPTDLTKTETQLCVTPPTPNDTTTPVIWAFTLIHSGNSNNYKVVTTVTDDVKVAEVRLLLDSALVTVLTAPTTLPNTYNWNLSIAAHGTHTVQIVAKDTSGNVTYSAIKSFIR